MFSAKKGVSPIIATVLLMAFAVALGAIVMTWGKNYVTEATNIEQPKKQITCTFDVGGKVLKSSGKPSVCVDDISDSVSLVFQNGGNYNLERLEVTLIRNDNTIQSYATGPVLKGKTVPVSYTFNQTTNLSAIPITQMIINPVIIYNNKEVICTDALQPISDIGLC